MEHAGYLLSCAGIDPDVRNEGPIHRSEAADASRSLPGIKVLGKVALKDQSWVTLKYALPPPRIPAVNWVHVNVDPSWRTPGTTRVLGVQTRDIVLGDGR